MSLEFTISALLVLLPLSLSLSQIFSLNLISSVVDVDLFLDARKELYQNSTSGCFLRNELWDTRVSDSGSELELGLFRIEKNCSPSHGDAKLEAQIEWRNLTIKKKIHLKVN
jgi:hypothetical protein